MLSLQNASLGYGTSSVLHHVSLDIEPGECIGLIGPNGGGKSTLLRTLAGLLPPRRGKAAFRGRPLANWPRRELAGHIAYLPQECPIPFAYRTLDVVQLGQYARLPWWQHGGEDTGRARQYLELVGIGDLAERPVTLLSGGQRQRALLARTLFQQGEVYLLDEPTAFLDPVQERDIFQIFMELAEAGRSVVIALHDLTLAARCCSRLILLGRGEIVRDGNWEEVLTDEAVSRAYGEPCSVQRDSRAVEIIPRTEGRSEQMREKLAGLLAEGEKS